MTEMSSGEFRDFTKRAKIKAKKKSKYRSISCRCDIGHRHDSRGEAAFCNKLHAIIQKGEIKTQKTFRMIVNGKTITSHRVDFFVTYSDGREEVYEFKGFETKEWKIKHKLFEALYPEIPYIVVRARDL